MTPRISFNALLMSTLLTVALPFAAQAGQHEGGANGGGGAGFCVDGRCVSLADAGFRFPQPGIGWEIDRETHGELDKIAALFPELALSSDAIVGLRGTIRPIEVDQSGRAKKFLKLYQAMLERAGQKASAKRVKLIGFSADNLTYVFQDRYDALPTANARARFLIHEAAVRRGATQAEATRFDGVLIDAIGAMASHQPVDTLDLVKAATAAKFLDPETSRTYLVGELIARSGGVASGPVLFGSSLDTRDRGGYSGINLKYNDLLRARALVPEIASDLNSGFVREGGRSWNADTGQPSDTVPNREKIFMGFAAFIRSKLLSSKATSIDVNDAILESYLSTRSPIERRILQACGTSANSSDILVASDRFPSGVRGFSIVSCQMVGLNVSFPALNGTRIEGGERCALDAYKLGTSGIVCGPVRK